MWGRPVKLILSRKGFDTSNSGLPSPILPDGRLVSIPIPADVEGSGMPYDSIQATNNKTFADLMNDLRIPIPPDGAHLDPDLIYTARPRVPGWRPLFGQEGAAQSHLENQHVGAGDVFLFFGRFRQTGEQGGRLCWANGRVVHAIFGFLEIGEILHADSAEAAQRVPWAADHPHIQTWELRKHKNTVYVANKSSALAPGWPAAGTIHFTAEALLTGAGPNPSVWHLTTAFAPHIGKLSYHAEPSRWSKLEDGRVALQSVGRGQEFVVCADAGLREWARGLIKSSCADTSDSCVPGYSTPPTPRRPSGTCC
jgi:hypothetical protein